MTFFKYVKNYLFLNNFLYPFISKIFFLFFPKFSFLSLSTPTIFFLSSSLYHKISKYDSLNYVPKLPPLHFARDTATLRMWHLHNRIFSVSSTLPVTPFCHSKPHQIKHDSIASSTGDSRSTAKSMFLFYISLLMLVPLGSIHIRNDSLLFVHLI